MKGSWNPGSAHNRTMQFKALLEEEDDEDRTRFFFGVESTTGFLVMPGHAVKRTYVKMWSTVFYFTAQSKGNAKDDTTTT